jgi:hypothetical protein
MICTYQLRRRSYVHAAIFSFALLVYASASAARPTRPMLRGGSLRAGSACAADAPGSLRFYVSIHIADYLAGELSSHRSVTDFSVAAGAPAAARARSANAILRPQSLLPNSTLTA